MSLPRIIQGKLYSASLADQTGEDDLRRLHAIRAACRSLRDALYPADWFSSVAHCREYKTIIVKTCGDMPREFARPERWDGFVVRYQPQD